MQRFILLTLAIAQTLAKPLPSDKSKTSYVTACENAVNCETYKLSNGHTSIRFIKGMEPGTTDYADRLLRFKAKREDTTTTQVTVSDKTAYWGCGIDPVATLNNVSSICETSGQCISNSPWSTDIEYVDPTDTQNGYDASSGTLTISATGTYPSWIRNGLVAGLQGAMGAKDVITTSTVTYAVTDGAINKNGPQMHGEDCTVATAPSYVGLGVYSAPNVLMATISAEISAVGSDGGNGLCGTAGIVGAIAGAFGPGGAVVGAIFGTVSASCSLAEG